VLIQQFTAVASNRFLERPNPRAFSTDAKWLLVRRHSKHSIPAIGTGNVGPRTQVAGYATNRPLTNYSQKLGRCAV
jgi:hypothetical protein